MRGATKAVLGPAWLCVLDSGPSLAVLDPAVSTGPSLAHLLTEQMITFTDSVSLGKERPGLVSSIMLRTQQKPTESRSYPKGLSLHGGDS